LSAMQQFMERARAVAPDGAGAPMLLVNTFHGTNSPGGASVAITFDSLEHWAKVTANQRTNPKWQALMQTFPVDSFKANYQGLTEIVWQSQGATPPTAGNILVIYGFNIVQGGVQPLMSFLDRLTDVGKKENIGGQPTVMVPMVTGAGNNQQATVVIRFDSAAAWAEAVAKQNSSSTWQQPFATFPARNYSLTNRSMSTVMTAP